MKTIMIFFFAAALLFGCSPEKRLARQQNAALNTVLASKPLLDKAGRQWSELNPCINDTTSMVFFNSDTAFILDTVTLTMVDTITKEKTIQKTIKDIRIIHDTAVAYIQDTRALRLLQKDNQLLGDSSRYYNSVVFQYQVNEKELAYTFKKFASALFRQWWFWALVAACGFYLFRHPLISYLSNLKR